LLRFGFALVVGWTDPEGSRPWLGALLLAYYDPGGRLVYAGRVGSGINRAELQRLWQILQPLATDKMALAVPPPRSNRFGSPLVLSRVHWVRPELVAEVRYIDAILCTAPRSHERVGRVRQEARSPAASLSQRLQSFAGIHEAFLGRGAVLHIGRQNHHGSADQADLLPTSSAEQE
jgi:ATP-dependent DNA ligase